VILDWWGRATPDFPGLHGTSGVATQHQSKITSDRKVSCMMQAGSVREDGPIISVAHCRNNNKQANIENL